MSQEKVDYKKELKKDRKKIVKKQHIERITLTIGSIVAAIVVVGWAGYSGYSKYQAKVAEEVTYTAVDLSSITDYLSSLTATDEDAE